MPNCINHKEAHLQRCTSAQPHSCLPGRLYWRTNSFCDTCGKVNLLPWSSMFAKLEVKIPSACYHAFAQVLVAQGELFAKSSFVLADTESIMKLKHYLLFVMVNNI